MDRIYLTGSTARSVRRLARQGRGIALHPSEVHAIEPMSRKRVTLSSLHLDSLWESLCLGNGRNVELLVCQPSERIRARGIKCHVLSRPLPPRSFEWLEPVFGSVASAFPHDLEVMVESPELSFLTAAGRLSKLVARGAIGRQEAMLRLLKLGVEDCSTYALDPWRPLEGECSYRLAPVMDPSRLRTYLSEAAGVAGLPLAREVGELVFERSASPMETFIHVCLALPPAMGSLGLPRPEMNKEIPVSEHRRLMLNHVDHITPDLVWETWKIIIEYLGHGPHKGDDARDEDMGRVQDYQVLGYLVFPVRFVHVQSPAAFNGLAVRLATAMDNNGGEGFQAWVKELVGDQDFLAKQRLLFATMLPPVQWA